MLTYTTNNFEDKSKKYQLGPTVQELIKGLWSCQGIGDVRTKLEPFPPYWRRREGKFRLMARIISVEQRHVVCLLDILERDSGEYARFLRDPRRFGTEWLDPQLDMRQIETSIASHIEGSGTGQIDALPILPENLTPWLQPLTFGLDENDLLVYESEEWLKRFRRREFLDFWATYYEIVCGIQDQTADIREYIRDRLRE